MWINLICELLELVRRVGESRVWFEKQSSRNVMICKPWEGRELGDERVEKWGVGFGKNILVRPIEMSSLSRNWFEARHVGFEGLEGNIGTFYASIAAENVFSP